MCYTSISTRHHNLFKAFSCLEPMGRIKSMVIKRTSRQLMEQGEDSFEKSFEYNKKALGSTLPSKKMRNRIAGYVTRLKRQKKTVIEDEDGNTERDQAK